jgi:transposase-like protein
MQLSEFIPPFCPKRSCPAHRSPGIRFWTRAGHYQPQCRSFRIPRFRCKVCRKGFSFQTFRIDYRDLRPEVNTSLMRHLVSGMSMRQAGRMVGLNIHGVQHKARKIARHLRLLNRNLTTSLPENRVLSLDELETFEHSSIQPVTVPVAIDDSSKFVIAVDVAPIRRLAKKGSRRQQRIEKHESKRGKREDRGRQSVHKVFGRLQTLLAGKAATLVTDQKACYATEVRRRFAAHVIHCTVNSKAPRTTQNPLFSINLTEAMMRDNNGRLRRRSWLVTKARWALRLQLEMFMAYRNWIRPRTNHDAPNVTPGVVMGLCPRNLTFEETLAWRQHWRRRSPHPMSETGLLSIEGLAS